MTNRADRLKIYESRIVSEQGICGGEPVSRGTRVTLRTILASLKEGDSPVDLLANFPSLTHEDIDFAIAMLRS
jgi:uncharacterized protein (DUF433 family)